MEAFCWRVPIGFRHTVSEKTSGSVSAGNTTLAATFTQRAAWIQTEYLKLLWNDDIDFFAVYKARL